MRDIAELWIIDESGCCIFNYAPVQSLDPNLFAGFMIALSQFGQSIAQASIQSLKLGRNLFVFTKIPSTNLLVVGRAEQKTADETRISQVLKDIYARFLEKFPPETMKEWCGDIKQFEPFKEDIEKFFEDKTTRVKG